MADYAEASALSPYRQFAFLASFAALGATLYAFPPGQYHFYPACPIHALTGCLCPGCGATRAMAALLHGHLAQALALNALFCPVLLPGALIYFGASAWRGRWVTLPPAAIYSFALVTAAFTLARNLH